MTNPSIAENDPPRRSRARRREAMINAVATILGCMALVVMIATVVRVVMVKLWESAKVNPDYVQSVYESTSEHVWSGNTKAQPSLLNQASPADARPGAGVISQTVSAVTGQDAAGKAAGPPAVGGTKPAEVVQVASIQDIEAKRPRIEQAVRGFFESSNLDQRAVYVRDSARVRPLMETYYQTHKQTALEWKNLGWVLPVEEPGYQLAYAQAVFSNAEPVSLIVEEMTDGSFRVDWESSVRYSELGWEEFIETHPTSPTLFRVIASKPQNLPAEPSPQGSEVLEIKHPDDNDVIYAYFDRKDPKFQPLLQQLQTGNWKDVPLTLRLCYPGPIGSGKNARIAEVEGKGWLILHGTRS